MNQNKKINPNGIGCYPVNTAAVDKNSADLKNLFSKLDPAECLAYAYELKYTAEKYGYKWFYDRANDITEEEDELDGKEYQAVLDRVDTNHANILDYYNKEAKEILNRNFNWNLNDDDNLWESINEKAIW
ncbi:hypothetical protein [Proteiniphilum acetatigenes]|uniref:hypothetical protein n=1 Tax=Proteiniphilum acetatigenes TaxID=294710 RepID=UPI0012F75118|nr:hypothetical protein [Proteiniphilum acetatigenes]